MRAAIADIVGRAGVDRNEKLRDLLDRHSVERRLSPSSAPLLAALRVLSNVRAKDRSSKTSVAARELVLRRKSCRPRSPVQGTVADELGSSMAAKRQKRWRHNGCERWSSWDVLLSRGWFDARAGSRAGS